MKDPYSVIGVQPGSDLETIKKAYKQLALKYHPDRNPDPAAAEKFKEINEAYDMLKKPKNTQKSYSDYGFYGGGFSDLNDIFDNFNTIFGDMGGFTTFRQRAHNVKVEYHFTLEEAFFGKDIEVTYKTPNGNTKSVKVKIPPGIVDRALVRCQGQGYSLNANQPTSDLIIVCRLKPHPLYKVYDEHLVHVKQISVFDALLGMDFDITTIDGKTITATIPKGVQHGDNLVIKGYGMPIRGTPNQRGDLLINVQVDIPTLSDNDLEKIKNLKNDLINKSG